MAFATLAQRARPDGKRSGLLDSLPFATIAGALVALMVGKAATLAWFRTGAWPDTDDAMRFATTRDWLSGQSFLDMHQYRLNPAAPVLMHWSRLPDLYFGGLLKLFSLVLAPEAAVRAMGFVSVFSFEVGFFALSASIARRLLGPAAMLPTICILGLSGQVVGEFAAGHIDHHGLQLLLAAGFMHETLAALDLRSVGRAALAGALGALSMQIGLETLPAVLALPTIFAFAFTFGGAAYAPAVRGFALGLGIASVAELVGLSPAGQRSVPAIDQFSILQATGAVLTCAAFLACAALAKRIAGPKARFAFVAAAGAAVLATLYAAFPGAFVDPMAHVDPLLAKVWLANVREAKPLFVAVSGDPAKLIADEFASVLGLAALLVAAWRERGLSRAKFAALALAALVGLATTLWQIRGTSGFAAFALFGGVWTWVRATEAAERQRRTWLRFASAFAFVPFGASAWAAALPVKAPDLSGSNECRAPANVALLDKLPRGPIFGPIDLGADVLAFTRQAVVAAPFHRNNAGNGELVRAMLAKPDDARAIVEDAGARWLVACDALPETAVFTRLAPGGLAAALRKGEAPAWLKPVRGQTGPYSIFLIR